MMRKFDFQPDYQHLIGVGIDAKHSNEDQIATFDRWIYGHDRCCK